MPTNSQPEIAKEAALQAAVILKKARSDVRAIMEEASMDNFYLGIGSLLDQSINKLSTITRAEIVNSNYGSGALLPVTNFMGEEIAPPTKITQEDISPRQAEKLDYIKKVDQLYNQFDSLVPDEVLLSYTLPEDQLVLRGVAKRAGVNDYENSELTLKFVEEISKGIRQGAANVAAQAEIDSALSNNKTKAKAK